MSRNQSSNLSICLLSKKFVKKFINCKGKYDTEGGYLDSILVYHEEDQKTLDIPKSKIFIGGSVKNNNIFLVDTKKTKIQ